MCNYADECRVRKLKKYPNKIGLNPKKPMANGKIIHVISLMLDL
jgi:hypothetical protein